MVLVCNNSNDRNWFNITSFSQNNAQSKTIIKDVIWVCYTQTLDAELTNSGSKENNVC